ncbi:tetratricopeptide repeat protein [Chitinophaga polysaccharea]|uniref:tetratricopeptide repeat protein n=1 Tax=Chitinophaga polysaccharea TaxID=1293035 RepID=UPI001159BDFE|nr:tetratricopeptide repeat protein [Chitinophaga polysaccharea]
MNKAFLTIALTLLWLVSFAQDTIVSNLQKLIDNRQFDEVIRQYAPEPGRLSAPALYYVGYACFMKQQDDSCLKFMDLSIAKDAGDHRAHFIKASTLNYMDRFDQAIKCFKTAIALKPDTAVYYTGLGDAYYNLHLYESALENYKMATEKKTPGERPFLMVAQVYFNLNQEEKALQALYDNTTRLPRGTEGYTKSWYNIGQMEASGGHYDKAETAFLCVIQSDSSDFHAYAKLIQVYFHNKTYEKAKPYKTILYDAHKQRMLQGNMEDMFCFDQFRWKDKAIQAYERYEEGPKERIFYKQVFYVIDSIGNMEFTIQTEYSPISVEMGGPKYILCGSQGRTHFNYGIGFNDDLKYDDLKSAVIKILERKYNAVAQSR